MMQNARTMLKRLIVPHGSKPRVIRGGRLKGLRFHCDLQKTTQLWRGVYEQRLQEWLVAHVKPGATCLDIGAAEGYFTLLMAKLAGPTGRVLCFEPGEDQALIGPNLACNGDVPLARVDVFHAPVSKSALPGAMAIDPMVSDGTLPKVDVVKIDVDGGEVDVLESMADTLARFHPALFVEIHSRPLLDEVGRITRSLGYQMTTEAPAPHEHRPIDTNLFFYST